MRAWPESPYVNRFRLVVWLGILANFTFVIPAVIAP